MMTDTMRNRLAGKDLLKMKIEHIAMYVSDLEAARDFFVKYLGGKSNDGYHNPNTGFRSYFISFDDGARLEIMNREDVVSRYGNVSKSIIASESVNKSEITSEGVSSSDIASEGVSGSDIAAEGGSDEQSGNINHLGYIHIAFSLGSKERVDELTELLRADGYEVLSGPRTTGDGYYESCVVGIEGNQIELTV